VSEAQDLLREALAREAEGQRLLLDGKSERAVVVLREVAALYRASWEAAPPRSFGRLVGYLKSAVLAGEAPEAADYVLGVLEGEGDSPASAYALALAAVARGDDTLAGRAAARMREGGEAFARTADALAALAARDGAAYEAALRAIVDDFEVREDHLTGVAIADTALVLERLARERGMAVRLRSPVLP